MSCTVSSIIKKQHKLLFGMIVGYKVFNGYTNWKEYNVFKIYNVVLSRMQVSRVEYVLFQFSIFRKCLTTVVVYLDGGDTGIRFSFPYGLKPTNHTTKL